MEKKQILFVVHQLNTGGVQKALLSVLNALDYDRCAVSLYIRKDRTDLLPQLPPQVKEIFVNRDRTRYYRRPAAVKYAVLIRLCRLLGKSGERYDAALRAYVTDAKMRYEKKRFIWKDRRFDVAVAFMQGQTARFVAEAVSADRKLMMFHVSVDEEHELHERILPVFDRILAVNEGCRDLIAAWYPALADRIGYIENYVDAGRVRALAKASPVDRPGAGTVLCSCGRLSAEKGFDLAVEAAALLRDAGLDYLWYFVGDGPARPALEARIARRGLEEQICITGMLENPYPYIAGADVYVHPSYQEAHSLALIEAMILNRPVVSTCTVGGKTILKNGGRGILTPITAAGLAEGILKMTSDASLRSVFQSAMAAIPFDEAEAVFRSEWTRVLLNEEGELR